MQEIRKLFFWRYANTCYLIWNTCFILRIFLPKWSRDIWREKEVKRICVLSMHVVIFTPDTEGMAYLEYFNFSHSILSQILWFILFLIRNCIFFDWDHWLRFWFSNIFLFGFLWFWRFPKSFLVASYIKYNSRGWIGLRSIDEDITLNNFPWQIKKLVGADKYARLGFGVAHFYLYKTYFFVLEIKLNLMAGKISILMKSLTRTLFNFVIFINFNHGSWTTSNWAEDYLEHKRHAYWWIGRWPWINGAGSQPSTLLSKLINCSIANRCLVNWRRFQNYWKQYWKDK